MNFRKSFLPAAALALISLIGCSGVTASKFTYTPNLQLNVATKDEGCYDAAVLLGADLPATKDIALKVLKAVDSTVKQESADAISAQRNRHIGVFVGSGGEEIFINFKSVDKGRTFVTVATKTGFVGGAGQKAWSCEIVGKMIELAPK